MRHWLIRLTAAALLGLPWAMATAEDSSADSIIKKVMAQSHTERQIKGIADFAIAELDLRKEVLEAKDYQELKTILNSAFDPKKLHQDVTQVWKKRFQAERFEKWSAQLQSPLLTKMSRLELQVSSNQGFEDMMAFAERQKSKPPTQARQDLIARLDSATASSELAIRGQLAVLGAFLKAINPNLPDNKQLNDTTLQKVLDATRAQIEPSLREIATLTYLYTYRNVSDADLSTYVRAYESDVGKWFMQLNRESISDALTAATQRAKKLIEQHLQAKKAA